MKNMRDKMAESFKIIVNYIIEEYNSSDKKYWCGF